MDALMHLLMDAPIYVDFEACDCHGMLPLGVHPQFFGRQTAKLWDRVLFSVKKVAEFGELPETTDSRHVKYRLTSCQNIIEYLKQRVQALLHSAYLKLFDTAIFWWICVSFLEIVNRKFNLTSPSLINNRFQNGKNKTVD